MKVRPIGDRLLVKREEASETTKSGKLVIPDAAKDPTQVGIVLAVGEGRGFDQAGQEIVEVYGQLSETGLRPESRTITTRKRAAPSINPGDRILFGRFSGTEVTVDEQQLFLLREDEVVAVLEEDGPAPS